MIACIILSCISFIVGMSVPLVFLYYFFGLDDENNNFEGPV